MFHMVVHSHKLGEVENECTFHNFIVLTIFLPNIIKKVKIWQNYDKNNFDCFFSETRCRWIYWLSTFVSCSENGRIDLSEKTRMACSSVQNTKWCSTSQVFTDFCSTASSTRLVGPWTALHMSSTNGDTSATWSLPSSTRACNIFNAHHDHVPVNVHCTPWSQCI